MIDTGDNKVRDHDDTKEGNSYRGASHWSCNINFKISKKLVVIFHNLIGRHLIFKELSKFNCNISVIPKKLEKYMSFTSDKNVVFKDSMLFLNSSLDKLTRTLSNEDFKYLSKDFSGEKLELDKKKGVYPYDHFDSFKRFK